MLTFFITSYGIFSLNSNMYTRRNWCLPTESRVSEIGQSFKHNVFFLSATKSCNVYKRIYRTCGALVLFDSLLTKNHFFCFHSISNRKKSNTHFCTLVNSVRLKWTLKKIRTIYIWHIKVWKKIIFYGDNKISFEMRWNRPWNVNELLFHGENPIFCVSRFFFTFCGLKMWKKADLKMKKNHSPYWE